MLATLAGLGTNFGLASLIGKQVAIISDARLGGRADQHAIAERLLSISGEDTITVDRKYREAWTARLQIRFLILSNELPRLADASGALGGRFIVLVLIHSFYGREDLGSPIGAFLHEECEVEPSCTVEANRLFRAWTDWCGRVGREHPGSTQTFGHDLRAALPGLKTIQPREGDNRLRYYRACV